MNKRIPIFHLLAFSLGILLAFALPIHISPFYGILLAMACLLPAWFVRKKHLSLWFFILLFNLLMGMSYSIWRTDTALAHRLPIATQYTAAQWVIRVEGLSERHDYGTRFQAAVLEGDAPVRRIMLSDYHRRDWPTGSVWQIRSRLRPPVGVLNNKGFVREAWALTRKIDATGSVGKHRKALNNHENIHFWENSIQKLRAHIHQRIEQYAQQYPSGAALTNALTLGNRAAFTDKHWQTFRHLGLSHLVSISGLHVGIAAVFSAALCLFLLKTISMLGIFRQPENPKIICTWAAVLVAFIYALLAGFSVPTQRSLLMIIVLAASLISRRYVSAWQIWQRALFAVLLFDPAAALSAGFYLSFGLVAALIAFFAPRHRQKTGKISLFFQTQYAATIASIVPVALFFGSIPLLSPIANIFAIPWFSLILTPLALFSALLPIDPLLWLSVWLNEHTIQILQAASNLAPMYAVAQSSTIWLLCALLATFFLLLPRAFGLHAWSILMLGAWIIHPAARPTANHAHIEVVDVGQGLAILIQTQQHTLLFDTGRLPASLALLPSIHAKGVRHLDALILSHNDQDHDGEYATIQAALTPKTIWAGQASVYPPSLHAQHCQAGKQWRWDGIDFAFLTPYAEDTAQEDNNASCVLMVDNGKNRILIPADLTAKGERKLMQQHAASLQAAVLILPHHGSNSSSTAPFLDRVQPQYAVSSSGYANHFSHPHPKVIQRLKKRNITLFRTDTQGAISIHLGEDIAIKEATSGHFYWQAKPHQTAAQ